MTRTSHVSDRRRFTTRDGKELSFTAMGFGSAPLGNYLRPLSEQDCDRTLSAAWDSGMRYFDTAPLYGYGLSEHRVGEALRGRARDELVLSTKVGRLLRHRHQTRANLAIVADHFFEVATGVLSVEYRREFFGDQKPHRLGGLRQDARDAINQHHRE